MIDPNIMNEHLEEEQPERYKRQTEVKPPAMPGVVFEEEDYGFEEEDGQEDLHNAPRRAQAPYIPAQEEYEYNNPIHRQDEEVVPGLYQSDVTAWKKQLGDVYHAQIKGQDFIFRSISRFEYKEIVGMPNTTALMREEIMCEYCVLYPIAYDFTSMANRGAGYPAVLSELIMDHSGLTRDVQIRKL